MRNAKWNVLILASALALPLLCPKAGTAASPAKQDKPESAAKNEKAPNAEVYRVHYTINEMEGSKTINSRSYALMAQPGKTARVRVGSRVPYSIGKNSQFQFQSVHMNIDCTLNRQDDGTIVDTRLSMETLTGKKTISADASVPVFGELGLTDSTSATLGKPAFVGSIDDVASNRRYVIEVTVTRAR